MVLLCCAAVHACVPHRDRPHELRGHASVVRPQPAARTHTRCPELIPPSHLPTLGQQLCRCGLRGAGVADQVLGRV